MSGSASMPERIGRFHIRSMLGRGAMGIVYLGHDEEIDRLVAIKLIRADLLDTEEREGYLKRFRNEAKIAGRCMHANIVGLYDFAIHDENPYLVMEYVDGIGLQQFFPRGSKRPVHEVIHIALQVLDALHYAHGRSIVHRDIKPANILMMPDLSLKITDFGISRLTSMELTVTPLLIGTPSYMSPEQCLGSVLDERNDLFSLGCVLYELAAGERPFTGVNYTETIFSIVNKPHVPLSQLGLDLPPGFSDAIDKALAKSPDQRHPDAASFARLLDDIARDARLARTGMPPVIVESGRSPRRAASVARHASLTGMRTGTLAGLRGDQVAMRPAADDAQPTISAPMTETVLVQPPGPAPSAGPPAARIEPPPVGHAGQEEDPDATLKRALIPRAVLRPAAVQPDPSPPAPVAAPPETTAPAFEPAPEATPEPVPEPAIEADIVPPAPAKRFDTGGDRTDTVGAADGSRLASSHAVSSPPPAPRPERPASLPDDPTEAGSMSLSPGPHFALPTPLGDVERARIVDCLATVLGPIAPLLARRVEQPGMSAAVLADVLAGHVRRDDERRLFHSLLARAGGGPAPIVSRAAGP